MREHAANAQSIYSVIEALQDMPSDQKARASKAAGEHDKRSRSPLRFW
jgi:hypothetical protein